MFKNRKLLVILLSVILLIFSISGHAYYKYTQESGANFYVGTGDKADALEDTNEARQIIDDLGYLLVHSKRNDLYPKDGTTGGTIQIPEAGLKFGNAPTNDDIAAYIAGEMTWQTKAELGIDLSLYYLKTEIDTLSEVEAIYTKNITDSDELASALANYYLKTAIDTEGEVETIWTVGIVNTTELATALTDYYLKTAIDSQGEMETIWSVSLENETHASEHAVGGADTVFPADPNADRYLMWDDVPGELVWAEGGGGGATTFVGLTDTPADYTGSANKFLQVNAIPDALVFDTISSDDLSDVDSIGMLDENEAVAGEWDFDSRLLISYANNDYGPDVLLKRSRDGDPTADIAEDDTIGEFSFRGYHTSSYVEAASIKAIVDGTPDDYDMPGRLEFSTTPDDYSAIVRRMAIDSAGNIKMGDGGWVNYVNVSAGGAMTFEGTASIDISSDDLSDVASIAMLDENEIITGAWEAIGGFHFQQITDVNIPPYLYFERKRDGDPTYDVSSGDYLSCLYFDGYHTSGYYDAVKIRVVVDGTPEDETIPGRLEFLTTPEGGYFSVLRMAIDNAGNIKMGDGAWTNYINITAGGAMTAEGTASIKATDLIIAGQATGDILYFNGTNWVKLAIGTAGQVLTVNAGATAPEWQTP